MRGLINLLLFCGIVPGLMGSLLGARSLAAQTVNVAEPTQVISREDLRSLGIVRLSDILRYTDRTRTVSLDGFATRFVLGGIGSLHEAPPDVFVDGHPIGTGLMAAGDLNLIGLPVEAIDRVEVYARPSLISGVFSGEGAIHIFTKQQDESSELHGRAVAGFENADAGLLPYAGRDRSARALQGPDLEATALGEIAGGSAMAAAVYRRHGHAERSGRQPLTVVTSPAAVYTWSDQNVHLSAVGMGVAADRFPFLPYASRVLSTDYQASALSAMAAHRIGERSFLRHRGTVEYSRARHAGDPGSWVENSVMWSSALARTLEERIVVLGGTAELRRVHVGQVSSTERWGSVFAAIAGRMAPGTQYRGGGAVALDGRSVAVKAYGGITIARWTSHRLVIYMAVADGLLHEQHAADFWARRELPPPMFPDEGERAREDVARRATFDADWRWQPSPSFEFQIGAGIRRSQKIYLPSRTLRDANGDDMHESIRFEYTSGTQGGLWGDVSSHFLPGRQRLYWSWQRTLTGRSTYEEAWDAIPDVRIGLSTVSPMLAGFRLFGSVTRESGRTWREFDNIQAADSEMKGNTLIDLYLSKRLFQGQLHAALGVLNLLGENIIQHPFGDKIGRTIRLDVRLDLVRRR